MPDLDPIATWERTLGPRRLWGRLAPELTYRAATTPATSAADAVDAAMLASARRCAGLDAYRLLEEIGRGGMGVVHRAHQISLDRDVAIKRVRADRRDAASLHQFTAEARVTGTLDHPNIVPVHELGVERDEPYLAMKLVGGTSWARLLRPADDADRARAAGFDLDGHLAILDQVANAVAFAHSRGVIHRDLKPANVMVGEYGEVLVTDWGLAVDIGDPMRPRRATPRELIDAPSGTPAYLAPEMAMGSGRDLGVHSDVYLLGAVLHEILTGEPPHRGADLDAVLHAAALGEPPRFSAQVPAGLAAICARAMARAPADRFPDVRAFQAALGEWRRHRASERLTAIARRSLDAAVDTGHGQASADRHARFAAALAGFEQALELWPDNVVAQGLRRDARLAYADAALAAGDLGLADAQLAGLAAGDPAAGPARLRLAAARREAAARERALRRNRRLLAGSLGVILAGLAIGLAAVSAEQRRTAIQRRLAEAAASEARSQRDRAEGLRHEAEASAAAAARARDAEAGMRQAAQRERSGADTLVFFMLRDLRRKLEGLGRIEILDSVVRACLDHYAGRDPASLNDGEQVQLATVLAESGAMQMKQGHFAEATATLRKAIAMQQRVVDAHPAHPIALEALGHSQSHLGRLLMDQHHTVEAITVLRAGIAVCERLLALAPGHEPYLHLKSMTHTDLGDALADAGQPAESAAEHARCLEICARIAERHPDDAVWVGALANACDRMGMLAGEAGRADEAMRFLSRALELRQRLVKAAPEDAFRQQRLAAALEARGIAHGMGGAVEPALADF